MRYQKLITTLTIPLLLLSIMTSLMGIFAYQSASGPNFTSVFGETVQLFGNGIYARDSISVAVQGIASDYVTLCLMVPSTLFALFAMIRKSLRGTLVLAGLLGYFLYTYTSYTFLWMYNPLFIVYVLQMSLSFFAFVLILIDVDVHRLRAAILPKYPRLPLVVFLVVLSLLVAVMWLSRIVPSIASNSVPVGLEHYNTLVIQALDLAFVIPASFIAAWLLIKDQAWGYLLACVLIFKYLALLMSISAMVILMMVNDVGANLFEALIFISFTLVALIMILLVLRNIRPTHLN